MFASFLLPSTKNDINPSKQYLNIHFVPSTELRVDSIRFSVKSGQVSVVLEFN